MIVAVAGEFVSQETETNRGGGIEQGCLSIYDSGIYWCTKTWFDVYVSVLVSLSCEWLHANQEMVI